MLTPNNQLIAKLVGTYLDCGLGSRMKAKGLKMQLPGKHAAWTKHLCVPTVEMRPVPGTPDSKCLLRAMQWSRRLPGVSQVHKRRKMEAVCPHGKEAS
jgi:hypothetical protein